MRVSTKALLQSGPRCSWLLPGQVLPQDYIRSWVKVCRNCSLNFRPGIPDMYPKAYRWVAEMREIAAFLGEDKAAAMIFEGAAQLYDRLATDIANEGKERGILDAFFHSK